MGYYTYHKLTIIEGNDHKTNYELEIGELSDYGESPFEGQIKWYDMEKDMKNYSKKYPKVLFCVDGRGEADDFVDIWKCYFQNGKMFKTMCTLTFEEFSFEKLAE